MRTAFRARKLRNDDKIMSKTSATRWSQCGWQIDASERREKTAIVRLTEGAGFMVALIGLHLYSESPVCSKPVTSAGFS